MTKTKLFVILPFLLIGSIISFFAWLTNSFIAYPKWKMLQVEIFVELFKQIQHLPPFHLFSSSYLVYIDLSTVTTLVVFITFLFATIGALKIMFDKVTNNTEHFPFWSNYKELYVQLGLLGTLFGFILAFRETTPEDPEIILLALGTALWSTFSAIFLAFLVCPIIFEKLLFGNFSYITNDIKITKKENVPVDEDITRIAQSFNNLLKEVNSTTVSLKKLGVEMSNLESVQTALREISTIKTELENLKKEWDTRYQTLLNDKLNQFELNLDEINKTISTTNKQLDNLKLVVDDHRNTKGILSTIRKLLKE